MRYSPKLVCLLVVLAVAGAGCSSPGGSSSTSTNPSVSPGTSEVDPAIGRQPLIVDYSPTVSDVGALLYLLSHPHVDVLAITLPVTGEAGCGLGLEVTLGILALFERNDVPVACDPEPPANANEWPAEFLTGHESLSEGLPPASDLTVDSRPAHQLIADVAAESDRPVTLLAVAPLTNVARALDLHPELADDLNHIVIMGGAVDAAGNVGDGPAEWNFWIDLPAAAQVLAAESQIILVPLDATNSVPVPASWPQDLEGAERSAAIEYLGSLVQTFPSVTGGFFYLWDELAASVAAGENPVRTEELDLIVVQQPGTSYGSTVRDGAGSTHIVATEVPEPDSFYAHFLETLARGP